MKIPFIVILLLVSLGINAQGDIFSRIEAEENRLEIEVNESRETTYQSLSEVISTGIKVTKLFFLNVPEGYQTDTLFRFPDLRYLGVFASSSDNLVHTVCQLDKLDSLRLSFTRMGKPYDLRCLGNLDSLKFLSVDEHEARLPYPILLPSEFPALETLILADANPRLPQKADKLSLIRILYGNFESFPEEIFNYKSLKWLFFINFREVVPPTDEELKKHLPKLEHWRIERW
ncbi:MAG: hypothetical protein AAF740_06620 [Bacteroidota bacterium]